MEMQHNDLAEQAMLSGDTAVAEQGVQLVAGGMKLPSIKVYKDNDTGNAQRFLDACGDNVRYCAAEKCWYVFDGVRWMPDNTHQVEHMALRALEKSYEQELEYYHQAERSGMMQGQLQKVSRRQRAAGNLNGLRGCVGMAAIEKTIDPAEFDADLYWTNLRNGALQMPKKEEDDVMVYCYPRPELYLSKVTNCDWAITTGAPKGKIQVNCPRWIKFVAQCTMGDLELFQYLWRAAGYSVMTGDISEQKVFCLVGAGRNGKSLFINTIAEIMGDYASKIESSILCRNRYGEKDNDLSKELYRIRGSRFVYSNEFGQDSVLNESFIKAITDGGKISCRPLYGASIEYTPTYTLWFSTNHLPNLQAMDAGIRRRIEVIPFQHHIPEELVDRNLPAYFKEEADQIFMWLILGYTEYQRQGLNPPEVVRQATAQYFAEQDVFSQFVEAHYQEEAEGKIYAKEIYQAYTAWCAETGQQRVSQIALGKELQRLGLKKKKDKHGTFYLLVENW